MLCHLLPDARHKPRYSPVYVDKFDGFDFVYDIRCSVESEHDLVVLQAFLQILHISTALSHHGQGLLDISVFKARQQPRHLTGITANLRGDGDIFQLSFDTFEAGG